MKLCAVQHRPVAGDVASNIAKHLALLRFAVRHGAQVVCFPELSLTGYEPRLAKVLAMDAADVRLDVFQARSERDGVHLGVGLPLAAVGGVQIDMVWFAPGAPRLVYAKQRLHADELPYFVAGRQQVLLRAEGRRCAPAICYESLQADHAAAVAALGAEVYLASVAKPARGVARARAHYPVVAQAHGMGVLMANCVGPSDDFVSAGQSAAWNARGVLLAQLDAESEGVVVLDLAQDVANAHRFDG